MTRTIAFLLSLGLATAAMAQDTTPEQPTDDTATETTEESTEAQEDSGLTMGAADGDVDRSVIEVGQPYTKEETGDWQLQCVKSETDEDPCQLYQLLEDETGNPVAEFSLFRLPEGGQAAAGATVVVPLETSLIEDLRIGVDGAQGKRYRFSFCSPVGCFARIGLTQQDVDAMKRGQTATITIVPWTAPDMKVNLEMSLIGFTAGLEKVTVAAAQQR
ncbi:MAG: invasion associated locus B family protein [Pseudooceanicola sp.]